MRTKMLKLTLMSIALASLVGCKSGGANITVTSTAEEVYSETCAACHNGGLKGWLTGAPKTGDKEVWKPIIAKGVDAMTAMSITGFEKMPAKGGCTDCSNEQIKAAVELMAAKSQ